MLDRQERTGKILDYLLSLPPWPDAYLPDTAPTDGKLGSNEDMPAAPEQDPGLPLVWGRHGFAFFANSVSRDPVTEAALGHVDKWRTQSRMDVMSMNPR